MSNIRTDDTVDKKRVQNVLKIIFLIPKLDGKLHFTSITNNCVQ